MGAMMKLRVGRVYVFKNDDVDPNLTWNFQIMCRVSRPDSPDCFIAMKTKAPFGTLQTIVVDERGIETGEFAFETPWRALWISSAAAKFKATV